MRSSSDRHSNRIGPSTALVITGGASGIGRLLALAAARKGARVVIWDRDEISARRVATEVSEAGGRGTAVVVDLADADAIELAAAETLMQGPIDVVINNAGVVSGRPLTELTAAQIDRTMRVNAIAPMLVTRAFLPSMRDAGRGRIVTVASAAGFIGVAGQTDYAASKFAAVGFMESLRAELRKTRSPITALTVAPYYIDTGMFAGVTTKVPALLPIMSQAHATTRIMRAIESSAVLLALPPLVRFVPAVKVLPTAMGDWLADALGVNEGMDGFIGRADDAAHPRSDGGRLR
ncbi:SDR family oxidoreductase [Agrococcus sp. Ld7]|uniref:SDR family oxidoreductase n=1 Tax=Agrococcus sp. Ld7 TaxID=649148 RepID=UPI00386E5FAE